VLGVAVVQPVALQAERLVARRAVVVPVRAVLRAPPGAASQACQRPRQPLDICPPTRAAAAAVVAAVAAVGGAGELPLGRT
jgi:hypothetical protein